MKSLSWRYRYVNLQRVTSEQLKELGSGTLLITNKRLLFSFRLLLLGLNRHDAQIEWVGTPTAQLVDVTAMKTFALRQ